MTSPAEHQTAEVFQLLADDIGRSIAHTKHALTRLGERVKEAGEDVERVRELLPPWHQRWAADAIRDPLRLLSNLRESYDADIGQAESATATRVLLGRRIALQQLVSPHLAILLNASPGDMPDDGDVEDWRLASWWDSSVIPALEKDWPYRFTGLDGDWPESTRRRESLLILAEMLQKAGRRTDRDPTPSEREPDEEGLVKNPPDPSAYKPASEIIGEPSSNIRSYHNLRKVLKKHPEIRRWEPNRRRLQVHRADWEKFIKSTAETADDHHPQT